MVIMQEEMSEERFQQELKIRAMTPGRFLVEAALRIFPTLEKNGMIDPYWQAWDEARKLLAALPEKYSENGRELFYDVSGIDWE